tara:strand:+ start:320 stop:1882 length:1563 start_codon:yes stop_codon:yes gene_type:complete
MALLVLFFLPFSSSKADPEIEEVFIVDDGWVEVPLDFTFPFYGNSYVTSFMFSNGVVGFLDPNDVPGTGYIHDGLCCDGQNFTGGATGVRFNYTIMPWHTDLIDTGAGRFYTQGDSTYQKYMWENIAEYYDVNKENSFDLTIYPMGNIEINYQELAINNHSVTVAVVGDLSAGEYEQWFYNHPTDGAIFWNSQQDDPVEISGGESICSVVPDSHISCLYYPQVYADNVYNQQCSLNPLYDYGCPGWDDAYIEEYVEPEEEEVWEEEEETYQTYVPEEPPTFIEYDLGAIEIDLDIPMMEEYEIELPEFEMEEFTQETMMADLEAEMEAYFDPLPEIEPEPVEEPMEETVEEELDEPEPEENSIQEEQTEEEQEQEEIIEEESEEEEAEEVEEEVEEEREEPEPEPEVEVVEEPKLAEKKKKDSKRDKMREIISKKLQSLATEMGEAASLEEQQKLQSLILALLNFNAGFNTYKGSLVDGKFYEEKDIYLNNKIPENQNGLRNGLANEILHNKLVDLQWQK